MEEVRQGTCREAGLGHAGGRATQEQLPRNARTLIAYLFADSVRSYSMHQLRRSALQARYLI